MNQYNKIYGTKNQKQMFDRQTSRKDDALILSLNENRFNSIEHFPSISSRTKNLSCNLAFDKQVSRSSYHKAFIQKQEEHKVDANAYSPRYELTRKRQKNVTLNRSRHQSRLVQSVDIPSGESLLNS